MSSSGVRERKPATQKSESKEKSTSADAKSAPGGGSRLRTVLLRLLVVALCTGAAYYSFVLDDTARTALRGQAQQAVNQLFPKHFTRAELARFDGSDPELPLLLAINGHVFDVSVAPEHYGKKGGYAGFAGRDGTRAYFDLCFSDECLEYVHCINTLSASQQKELKTWVDFYMKEAKYPFVGFVTPDEKDAEICEAAVAKVAAKKERDDAEKARKKAEAAAKKAAEAEAAEQ